jgi:hypothetical protein
MARTSWTNDDQPLLCGHVRAYKDNQAEQYVVETTKYNPAGSGLEVCRAKFGRAAEVRAILALADLLKRAEPFVALGQELAMADADAPLISHTGVELEITVGDCQRLAEAWAKAYPPTMEIPQGARIRKRSGRKYRPR